MKYNPVAKNAHKVNKRAAGPHKDKKRADKRGERKHKGKAYEEVEEGRNYKKEYENYHSRPEQKKRRAARNGARRMLKDRKNIKGMDVHHKDNDPTNNDKDNLSIVTQHYNRKEPRMRKEALGPDAGVKDYIDDFQKSDAPQFQGKDAKKRKEMAIAAYLDAKRGKKEEVDEGMSGDNWVLAVKDPKGWKVTFKGNKNDRAKEIKKLKASGKKAGVDYVGYLSPGRKVGDIIKEDLRKWFGKGKKGDWVRVGTDGEIKGDCAREPGEGKPKCMPRSRAHGMDKKDRASAARRKRRADPQVDRPGTGNKPIMVKTEKESVDEKTVGFFARRKAMKDPKVAGRVAAVQKREKDRTSSMSFSQKRALKKRQSAGVTKRYQSQMRQAAASMEGVQEAMDYDRFDKQYTELEKRQDAANAALKKARGTERGAMGLTPDNVRKSPSYQKAKADYERATNEIKKFLKGVPKQYLSKRAKARRMKRFNTNESLQEGKLKVGDKVKTPAGTVEILNRMIGLPKSASGDKFRMVLHTGGKKVDLGSHPAPTDDAVKKIAGYYKSNPSWFKESVELEEKNVPTNPKLWAKFKSQAKSKFDVYPSAYANGWAAKQYKAAGGGWKTTKESIEEAKYEVKNGKIHISKAEFRKVHRDFKNTTRGKERMMANDPKTGGSASYEVVFTEAKKSGLEVAREVVKTKSAKDGIDLTTAGAIIQVYDKLKRPDLRKRFEGMDPATLANVVWKLVGKMRESVSEETISEMAMPRKEFEKLKKGDKLKFTFDSAMKKGHEVSLVVTGKSRSAKYDVDKVNMKDAGDPRNRTKFTLYSRKGGDATLAWGDAATVMQKYVKEGVDEASLRTSDYPKGTSMSAKKFKDSQKKMSKQRALSTKDYPKGKSMSATAWKNKQKEEVEESAQDRLDRSAAKHGLGKPNKAADDYLAMMMKKYGAKDMADLKKKMGMKEGVNENFRTLATKGMGAEKKSDIKVGHTVDYYDKEAGNKHTGEIVKMGPRNYQVKDEKTGKVHTFNYYDPTKARKMMKEHHINELTQRELDMMADRKQKNLVKRGKAKAEPKKPASAGRTQNVGRGKDEGDDHIVMQLRKAQDVKGNMDIKVTPTGKTVRLPSKMIDKLLATHDKLQKPDEKRKFRIMVTKELRKRAK